MCAESVLLPLLDDRSRASTMACDDRVSHRGKRRDGSFSPRLRISLTRRLRHTEAITHSLSGGFCCHSYPGLRVRSLPVSTLAYNHNHTTAAAAAAAAAATTKAALQKAGPFFGLVGP